VGAEHALAHRHLPTAFSPILKRKLPRPIVRTAWPAASRRVRPMIVLPSGKTVTYSPACSASRFTSANTGRAGEWMRRV
jgi:hypothetical protein